MILNTNDKNGTEIKLGDKVIWHSWRFKGNVVGEVVGVYTTRRWGGVREVKLVIERDRQHPLTTIDAKKNYPWYTPYCQKPYYLTLLNK